MEHILIWGSASLLVAVLYQWYLYGINSVKEKWKIYIYTALIAFLYYILIFQYKPFFYYENYLIFMIILSLICHVMTRLNCISSMMVGFLFGIGCRISTQVAIYPFVMMLPQFVPEILEKNVVFHILIEGLTAFFRFLMVWLMKKNLHTLVKTREKGIAFLIIVIPFLLSFTLQICVLPQIDERYQPVHFQNFLIYTILTLLAYASLLCGVYLFTEYSRRMEAEQIQKIMQNQYTYYKRKDEMERSVRILYHDMKNHLNCIAQMESKQEIEAYISEINQELKPFEVFSDTGNVILDAIINEKCQIALNQNIRIQTMIDFSNGKFLKKIDICTIFGNLLDNAIEAAAKVEKVENRWIHLKTATKQSHIIIKVTNSFSGEVRKEAGQFASTKHRKGHGLGLLSIETCLKKYSGKMEIETVGDHFRVIVMIPIPESKRPVREIQ